MYKGVFKELGIIVYEKNALDYAILRIAQGSEEEKKEFVEWFYSGNWVEENNESEVI